MYLILIYENRRMKPVGKNQGKRRGRMMKKVSLKAHV
jgi:hypothetical protein